MLIFRVLLSMSVCLWVHHAHSNPYEDSIEYSEATLLALSEQGDHEASYALAKKYHLGLGVVPNIKKAIDLYALAAKHNHAYAAGNLATIYADTGRYKEAEALFKQAIELGSINAPASYAIVKRCRQKQNITLAETDRLVSLSITRAREAGRDTLGTIANEYAICLWNSEQWQAAVQWTMTAHSLQVIKDRAPANRQDITAATSTFRSLLKGRYLKAVTPKVMLITQYWAFDAAINESFDWLIDNEFIAR